MIHWLLCMYSISVYRSRTDLSTIPSWYGHQHVCSSSCCPASIRCWRRMEEKTFRRLLEGAALSGTKTAERRKINFHKAKRPENGFVTLTQPGTGKTPASASAVSDYLLHGVSQAIAHNPSDMVSWSPHRPRLSLWRRMPTCHCPTRACTLIARSGNSSHGRGSTGPVSQIQECITKPIITSHSSSVPLG
jgi:hypothetical protein